MVLANQETMEEVIKGSGTNSAVEKIQMMLNKDVIALDPRRICLLWVYQISKKGALKKRMAVDLSCPNNFIVCPSFKRTLK